MEVRLNKNITYKLGEVPNIPCVYIFLGGKERAEHIVYVGIANKLRDRLIQHLVNYDSSVTCGMSTARIIPDKVSKIKYWSHREFKNRVKLEAAELIAFDFFNPILKSRGKIRTESIVLASNAKFKKTMENLFSDHPLGIFIRLDLDDVIERLLKLEKKIEGM